ncbi:efflux RND transporter permease subunit [Shewanella psychromarinicola]|uniref:Efflux RND transporter permease subunit n=1 Tax=Shewanella psychromarinicola TaxID=2487742 RepID=A0A3N4DSA7_9GAMM|nr:efflux RND transporter permease subunit [Shewanella psychromarinicola]AZG37287.1 efflux RND transporter permease subunit [Shewanella psychromarinicola]MCL1084131.1 efflux RND transporter permease subunit [Shewanella psychromarinicola]RPA27512.1 efflux RND transporter permease subunit [Shewanella psychromarinicola]
MIAYITRHPTLANLLMLSLLLLGLLSLGSIKRETFPEFAPPYVTATVVYPGASPIEVEESLCLRMEDAVDGLGNVEEVKCDAQEGVASMTIKLDGKADIGRAIVDVQTQINGIKNFPSQIEPPIVKELDWAEPVVDIAISADASWPHLKHYAEDLKRRLKIDAGVSLVSVIGFSDHQLRVELNQIDMRRLGLTATDIADEVGRQNVKIPAGNIELTDKNLLLRFDERKVTPAALKQTIVASTSDGSVVRLGDIATVTDRFELDEEHIFFNGQHAAILKVKKNKADDALRIKQKVSRFIEQERLRVPDGVNLTLTNDLSSLLKDRLDMMLTNGWQGIILVFFSMWLFFSLRYSFWVSAGLPVAFLGGIYLMSLFGVSINIMSLVGLLMAIGIMMDDAIVIAESIASHVDRGLAPHDAVVQGVKKVAPGVVSSFLTTILIFSSLLGLDGQMGAVLSAIPTVLIMVLSISLIEAFLILPNHLNHSLSHVPKKAPRPELKFKRDFLAAFETFRNTTLVNAVRFVVHWRYASVGITLGILLSSVALVAGGVLKFLPFPELDGDIAEVRIILPPGSPLSSTQEVVEQVILSAKETAARYTQEVEEGVELIEDITAQFNFNADAGEKGPHVATVRLDLLSAETRNTLIEDFIEDWRDGTVELAAPLSMVFKQPTMGPAGRDIEVRLLGDDLDMLKQASVSLQSYLARFDGINGILDDMRPGKEEIKVSLRPGAEVFGIDGQLVANQLRSAFFGQRADEIQIGPENIEIEVRLNKEQAGDLHALANFPIMLANGEQLPLSAIAKLEHQRSYVRIQRINSQRSVTVMADVDNRKGNSTETLAKIKSDWLPQATEDYPGVKVDFEGSAKETAKTGASLGKGFLIGIFGLFVILSFQFRSYLEPVVVMLAIPLSLIGVLWGHVLLGYNLSMPSIMGFISLAGIVVNDSILLVQYIRHHVDEGDSVHEAVVSASRERFRAVFLTSLTTAAGLLPLLLETSLQAQVVQPLVVSIVFGIFASTLMVLFIIPCAYAILADFGLVKKHQKI